jgi:hypothetical protein
MRPLIVFGLLLTFTAAPVQSAELAPACEHPAPLVNHPDPKAPGVFIELQSTVADPEAAALRLMGQYGFDFQRFKIIPSIIFVATITPEDIARLLCEAVVKTVSYNGSSSTGGVRSSKDSVGQKDSSSAH